MKSLPQINDLKLLEIVNRIPFFKEFTPQERQFMLKNKAQFVSYRDNEFILREGSLDTELYVILSGKVHIRKASQDKIVGTLEAGEFLGEGAFITSAPRSITASAAGQVIAMRISQDALNAFPLNIKDRVKSAIIEGMATRIVRLNHKLLKYL